MNNMDDSMDTEQSLGGISRRDMIKMSVAAGALVWSAPVLLTGRASADHVWPPDPPAENCPCAGTLVRFKIGSDIPSANCGQTLCLDARDPGIVMEVPCGDAEEAVVCAIKADQLISFTADDFPQGTATLVINPLITLVAVAVRRAGGECIFTDCGANHLSIARLEAGMGDPPNPPNTDVLGNTLLFPNQVWVTDSGQTINIQLNGNPSNITEINLLLCVSRAVTGMC